MFSIKSTHCFARPHRSPSRVTHCIDHRQPSRPTTPNSSPLRTSGNSSNSIPAALAATIDSARNAHRAHQIETSFSRTSRSKWGGGTQPIEIAKFRAPGLTFEGIHRVCPPLLCQRVPESAKVANGSSNGLTRVEPPARTCALRGVDSNKIIGNRDIEHLHTGFGGKRGGGAYRLSNAHALLVL